MSRTQMFSRSDREFFVRYPTNKKLAAVLNAQSCSEGRGSVIVNPNRSVITSLIIGI